MAEQAVAPKPDEQPGVPGPWYAHVDGAWEGKPCPCKGIFSDGLILAGWYGEKSGGIYGIGFVPSVTDGVANARLMAASPQLLDACRTAIAQTEYHEGAEAGSIAAGALDQLRAAIQKAGPNFPVCGADAPPPEGKEEEPF